MKSEQDLKQSNTPTLHELIRKKSAIFDREALYIISQWRHPYTANNEIDLETQIREAKFGTERNNDLIRESERFLEFVASPFLPRGLIGHVGSDILRSLAIKDLKKIYEVLATSALTIYATIGLPNVQENYKKGIQRLLQSKAITVNEIFCAALQESLIKSNPEKSFGFLKELGADLNFPCPTPQGKIYAIDLAITEKNRDMFRALQ